MGGWRIADPNIDCLSIIIKDTGQGYLLEQVECFRLAFMQSCAKS